jgi:hypothetical protein
MYKIAIKNNETKEIRLYICNLEWEEHSAYMWTDGNYGCDCNRAILFEEAIGNEIDDSAIDLPCGEERYTCLYAELEDESRIELDEV